MAEAWDINDNTADPDEQQDTSHADGAPADDADSDGQTHDVSDDADSANEADEDGLDDRGLNRGRSGSES